MNNLHTTINSKASSPKGYALLVCNIITNNETSINLIDVVHDIKINESLYASGLTADIFILDSLSLLHELKLSGNEKIELVIGRNEPNGKQKTFDLTLYIAAIKGYSTPNPSSKSYTLECVSKHVYLNNSKILNRPFEGNASDIIKKVVNKDLNTSVTLKAKAESKNLIKGIFTNLQPLQGISWLLRNSFDNGTPFYFYETAFEGVILNSYNQILKDYKNKPYKSYNNYPFFISSVGDGKDGEKLFEEESSKITKIVSQLNLSKHAATLKGSYTSMVNTINISNKTVSRRKRFTKLKSTKNLLNNNPAITSEMKIDNKKISEFEPSKQHYISINTKAFSSNYKNYHQPTWYTIEDSIAAQHSLDTIQQEIIIPGDFELCCGKIVNLNLLKNADVTEELIENDTFKDDILSGNHLVTGILHHFGKEGYNMNVVLKKDSFIKPLVGI